MNLRSILTSIWSGARSAWKWTLPKVRPAAIWAWNKVHGLAIPPDYRTEPEYKESENWLAGFSPSENNEGYDKALQYAFRRYDQVSSASDTLDKKADNLMRNAGLVAGLLGLALNTLKIPDPRLLIPSILAFAGSLIIAAVACNPTGGATSASVHDVLDDIGAGHRSDAWIAASIHCAIVGRSCLNNWKATRIRWSTTAFCIGLILLVLPILLFYVPHWAL